MFLIIYKPYTQTSILFSNIYKGLKIFKKKRDIMDVLICVRINTYKMVKKIF